MRRSASENCLSVSKGSSFLLSKWYLDCLEPTGDGAIVYVAELRWKALRMRYASTLTLMAGKVQSTTSIRTCPLPEREGGRIRLQLPQFGVEGVWEGFAAPIERTIFEDTVGFVHWNCLQPASRAALSLHGRRRAGWGYAELLRITIPPWRLPLSELHWGRFVTESDALVWIDWRGSHTCRLLLHNGVEQEVVSIAVDEVRSPNVRLTLDRGMVLRSGELGSTVFRSMHRLARIVPGSMLQVHECKWRSQALLRQGEHSSSGWGIHEVVRWQGE